MLIMLEPVKSDQSYILFFCSFPQVQHIQWPEIRRRERSQRHRCTKYPGACLKQGQLREAISVKLKEFVSVVHAGINLDGSLFSIILNVLIDKVWRHSYLRRSPVCNLLCTHRREPGRRPAPDENQTDPGLVQAGLWWSCILSHRCPCCTNCHFCFHLNSKSISVVHTLTSRCHRLFLMNATKPRTPHPQKWARQFLTCRTSCHTPEWCTPVPQVKMTKKHQLMPRRIWDKIWKYTCLSGASEPKNMIYMSRLGIWGEGTPFRTFDDFLHAIEKRYVECDLFIYLERKNLSSLWLEGYILN